MKTPIISVAHAGAIKTPGFGRIELCVHGTPDQSDYVEQNAHKRLLVAAVYKVASRLEEIAAVEGLEFTISLAGARLGAIDIDFRPDNFGADCIDEILIEACADCDLEPTDLLVESGAIQPNDEG